ncbi:hypothetical protein IVA78_26645 [Bradyrhizobium sp. 137]|uniref:hypothetical protein n=1 Tax=Bradyrhizobium sp. 137 TaxID=2782614 RepID=UPI001FF70B5B|nr:hypothetical protein [Bradyrhizobium sp. 137]MCK1758656.1 hypothetical protein [Bradyrhizobium sp. 137]
MSALAGPATRARQSLKPIIPDKNLARVIGIAGGDAKCKFVTKQLGFHACVSHLSPTLSADLAAVCQAGVDVYFENVGEQGVRSGASAVQSGRADNHLWPHRALWRCGRRRRQARSADETGEPIFKAREWG